MKDCQEHGDVYLDCEGECHARNNEQTLCSAHWGAYIAKLALGVA